MSYNPYNSPQGFGPQGYGAGPQFPGGNPYVAGKVKAPAICLMVAIGIGIAWQLLSVVLNALGTGVGAMGMGGGGGGGAGNDPQGLQMMVQGTVGIVFNIDRDRAGRLHYLWCRENDEARIPRHGNGGRGDGDDSMYLALLFARPSVRHLGDCGAERCASQSRFPLAGLVCCGLK